MISEKSFFGTMRRFASAKFMTLNGYGNPFDICNERKTNLTGTFKVIVMVGYFGNIERAGQMPGCLCSGG